MKLGVLDGLYTCKLDQLDICEVFLKEFLRKTTIFRSHFWRKSSKKVGIYYIKICILKNLTKGNRLVLVLDLYQAKHMFSADASWLWKVVCLNVYIQGTIWNANAHCAYFVIVKFCSMHFVLCSVAAWNIEVVGTNPRTSKKFLKFLISSSFHKNFIRNMFLVLKLMHLTHNSKLLAKKCVLDQ